MIDEYCIHVDLCVSGMTTFGCIKEITSRRLDVGKAISLMVCSPGSACRHPCVAWSGRKTW